jgi:hypothetical protein
VRKEMNVQKESSVGRENVGINAKQMLIAKHENNVMILKFVNKCQDVQEIKTVHPITNVKVSLVGSRSARQTEIVALSKVVTVSNVLWLALLTMTVLTRRCKFFLLHTLNIGNSLNIFDPTAVVKHPNVCLNVGQIQIVLNLNKVVDQMGIVLILVSLKLTVRKRKV